METSIQVVFPSTVHNQSKSSLKREHSSSGYESNDEPGIKRPKSPDSPVKLVENEQTTPEALFYAKFGVPFNDKYGLPFPAQVENFNPNILNYDPHEQINLETSNAGIHTLVEACDKLKKQQNEQSNSVSQSDKTYYIDKKVFEHSDYSLGSQKQVEQQAYKNIFSANVSESSLTSMATSFESRSSQEERSNKSIRNHRRVVTPQSDISNNDIEKIMNLISYNRNKFIDICVIGDIEKNFYQQMKYTLEQNYRGNSLLSISTDINQSYKYAQTIFKHQNRVGSFSPIKNIKYVQVQSFLQAAPILALGSYKLGFLNGQNLQYDTSYFKINYDLENTRRNVLVYIEDGITLGMINYSIKKADQEGYIDRLISFKGTPFMNRLIAKKECKVGTSLLDAACYDITNKQYEFVKLHSLDSAESFYVKNGFEKISNHESNSEAIEMIKHLDSVSEDGDIFVANQSSNLDESEYESEASEY